MYLLGLDLGSSSVKAALVSPGGETFTAQSPDTEMSISAPRPGWAEQEPTDWWTHVVKATRKVLDKSGVSPQEVGAVGISYQMHGLVLLDADGKPLRPSIIWCDSRAVEIGNRAFADLGEEKSLSRLLNSPGNFTASKLRWVVENEPELLKKARHAMLPGDYIAYELTGKIATTASGLSEGTLWDFAEDAPARFLLDHYGLDESLIPPLVPTLGEQGKLSEAAAQALGLPAGIPLTYRAGDQPNNALSLGVLEPGQVAATGGTSGVIYAVTDRLAYDSRSRVNSFAHVNHTAKAPRVGVLLCINGAGIAYAWTKRLAAESDMGYYDMEKLASEVPVGSEGLRFLPFGNGAERMLENQSVDARLLGLDFNRHDKAHLYRSALEGVAFSFAYGAEILEEMGVLCGSLRVGNDNLFRSAVFGETVATLLQAPIEVVAVNGATGAARAAGVAVGAFSSLAEAAQETTIESVYRPQANAAPYRQAYAHWKEGLENALNVVTHPKEAVLAS